MTKTLLAIRISTMALWKGVDRSMSKRPFGWILFCKTTKVPSTFYLKRDPELRKAVKKGLQGLLKKQKKRTNEWSQRKKKKHMEDKT